MIRKENVAPNKKMSQLDLDLEMAKKVVKVVSTFSNNSNAIHAFAEDKKVPIELLQGNPNDGFVVRVGSVVAKTFRRRKYKLYRSERESMEKLSSISVGILHPIAFSDATRTIYYPYVNGGDLVNLISIDENKSPYPLQMEEIALIMETLVSALWHAQKVGLNHRDIKLDNIVCSLNGQGQIEEVFLIDWALSSVPHSVHCGTAPFLAPEIVCRRTNISLDAVDVWALGVLLFILYSAYKHGGGETILPYSMFDSIETIGYTEKTSTRNFFKYASIPMQMHYIVKNAFDETGTSLVKENETSDMLLLPHAEMFRPNIMDPKTLEYTRDVVVNSTELGFLVTERFDHFFKQ